MSNILIVESENDQFFIQRMLKELNIKNTQIDPPICNIHEYECLGGLSDKSLTDKLAGIGRSIRKGKIDKLGILLDANSVGIDGRVEKINKAIQTLDKSLSIKQPNTWYHSETLDLQMACHIINVDGHGELETLLKVIKSKPSIFADCLNVWRDCLKEQDESITDKDFGKLWINNYQRFDCCSKKEKKQAGRKCNPETSMEKNIWNFEHDALTDLKVFLQMFAA